MHTLTCRWENTQKQRYYRVSLYKDLLGDMILFKCWGSLNSRHGGEQKVYCQTIEESEKLIQQIGKIRQRRGYQEKR